MGEKVNANMVVIDEEIRKEEVFQIEIKEISKEGKLFLVKGLQLRWKSELYVIQRMVEAG